MKSINLFFYTVLVTFLYTTPSSAGLDFDSLMGDTSKGQEESNDRARDIDADLGFGGNVKKNKTRPTGNSIDAELDNVHEVRHQRQVNSAHASLVQKNREMAKACQCVLKGGSCVSNTTFDSRDDTKELSTLETKVRDNKKSVCFSWKRNIKGHNPQELDAINKDIKYMADSLAGFSRQDKKVSSKIASLKKDQKYTRRKAEKEEKKQAQRDKARAKRERSERIRSARAKGGQVTFDRDGNIKKITYPKSSGQIFAESFNSPVRNKKPDPLMQMFNNEQRNLRNLTRRLGEQERADNRQDQQNARANRQRLEQQQANESRQKAELDRKNAERNTQKENTYTSNGRSKNSESPSKGPTYKTVGGVNGKKTPWLSNREQAEDLARTSLRNRADEACVKLDGYRFHSLGFKGYLGCDENEQFGKAYWKCEMTKASVKCQSRN